MARRGQAGRITLSMNPVIFSAAVFSVVAIGAAPAAPVVVTLNTTDGMKRGGTPYFVKGAGGDSQLPLLAGRGANSIRTWSTDGLGKTLDEAARAGLTVSAGIWLEPECSWFSYRNAEHCARQSIFHDFADFIEMGIQEVFLMMGQAPLRHDGSTTRDNI